MFLISFQLITSLYNIIKNKNLAKDNTKIKIKSKVVSPKRTIQIFRKDG